MLQIWLLQATCENVVATVHQAMQIPKSKVENIKDMIYYNCIRVTVIL